MKVQIIIHTSEQGDFWAEAPALVDCYATGETMEEVAARMREEILECLALDCTPLRAKRSDRIVELDLGGDELPVRLAAIAPTRPGAKPGPSAAPESRRIVPPESSRPERH